MLLRDIIVKKNFLHASSRVSREAVPI